jgi:hypothetical protein
LEGEGSRVEPGLAINQIVVPRRTLVYTANE